MLRLWQTEEGDSAAWRASLEDPHTGESRAFSSREELYAFLEDLTRHPAISGVVGDATDPSGQL